MLASVTNTLLAEGDQAWIQPSSSVKFESLEILKAIQVAPSVYVASVAASADLMCASSSASLCSLPAPFTDVALVQWSKDHTRIPSQRATACQQKVSDGMSVTA